MNVPTAAETIASLQADLVAMTERFNRAARERDDLTAAIQPLVNAVHAWDTSISWAHEEAYRGETGAKADAFEIRLHEAYDAWDKWAWEHRSDERKDGG